jgi:hypothetical protein
MLAPNYHYNSSSSLNKMKLVTLIVIVIFHLYHNLLLYKQLLKNIIYYKNKLLKIYKFQHIILINNN